MSTPLIHLAFARTDHYVSHVEDEHDAIREALAEAERADLCEVTSYTAADERRLIKPFRGKETSRRTAILHYGGHANSLGLFLQRARWQEAGLASENTTLSYWEGLVAYLSQQPALKLVFLNGCETMSWGKDLAAAGVPIVIGTTREVSDAKAARFAVHFYELLSDGFSIGEAFNFACAFDGFVQRDGSLKDIRSIGRRAEATSSHSHCAWTYEEGPNAEQVLRLTLAGIAGLPNFDLPPLPKEYYENLPQSPFVGLHPFDKEHAALFFGRRDDLVRLIAEVNNANREQVVVLHGQTGVGKSSLLAAGLLPRLEATHDVRYSRRDSRHDGKGGLSSTLDRLLAQERQTDASGEVKPLVLILDQVEEAWTQMLTDKDVNARDLQEELEAFVVRLSAFLATHRRTDKVILSLRKEWLAEIGEVLDPKGEESESQPRGIRYHPFFIRPLDARGVEQAIYGVARDPKLRDYYKLTVERVDNQGRSIVRLIQEDLTVDADSPLAPVLQILLRRMWEATTAERPSAPRFDVKLYEGLRQRGDLLRRFLERRLDELKGDYPEEVESGLVLDVLEAHTTDMGTSIVWTQDQLRKRYPEAQGVLDGLLDACQRLHLLIDPDPRNEQTILPATRLAHDTLAPMVRAEFAESDRPGQRARRVVENRAPDWRGKDGPPLGDTDLELVEQGKSGMRRLQPEEERLLKVSKEKKAQRDAEAVRIANDLTQAKEDAYQREIELIGERQEKLEAEKKSFRQRRYLWIAGSVFSAMIAGLAAVLASNYLTLSAERIASRSQSELSYAFPNPTNALALAVLAKDAKTPEAVRTLFTAYSRAREQMVLPLKRWDYSERITHAAFSPDDRRVITASANGTAQIWDAQKGEPVDTLVGHRGGVTYVAFDRDGSRIVTASVDSTARVWDAEKGETLAILTEHRGAVTQAVFSQDGTRIVTASTDSTARVWSTDGALLLTLGGHEDSVVQVAINHSGRRIVTLDKKGTPRLWDAIDGKPLRLKEKPGEILPDYGPVVYVALNPNPTRDQFVTTHSDGSALLWNATAGTFSRTLTGAEGHTGAALHAAFNSDGQRAITVGREGTARIWNTGKPLHPLVFIGHEGDVHYAAFSPDDQRMVTASADGTARLWDVSSREQLAILEGHRGAVIHAAFSSNGERIFTLSDDGTARLWDASPETSLASLWGHEKTVLSATFDHAGQRVVTASQDATVRVWDASTGKAIDTLAGHVGHVNSAVFNSRGTFIVTSGQDRTARLWEMSTGLHRELRGHAAEVHYAAFDPKDARIVTASEDGTARLWDASTGDPLLVNEAHRGAVVHAAFSPDGVHIVTASDDHTTRIWNVSTGAQRELRHGAEVHYATFDFEGQRVLTAGADGTARVWSASTGGLLHTLEGHRGAVVHAAFSLDGARIVTAGDDHTARIWNVGSNTAPRELLGHQDAVNHAAFGPSGGRVATASQDGSVRLWDVETGLELAVLSDHRAPVSHVEFDPGGDYIVTAGNDDLARIYVVGYDKLMDHAQKSRLPEYLNDQCEFDELAINSGIIDKIRRWKHDFECQDD